MNKCDEIILEIEGKIQYAKSTGNAKAEVELQEIKLFLESLNGIEDMKTLCEKCYRGELGNCFCKPGLVINKKVVRCPMFKE